jgi:hypothetical protein
MIGTTLPVINDWIDDTLTTDVTLQNLVGAARVAAGQWVFEDYLPDEAPFPSIVYQNQSSVTVRGVGPVVIMEDTLYIVKVIAQVSSYNPLRAIANRIEFLVADRHNIIRPDGEILGTAKDAPFQLPEVDAGRQYRHLGGIFRIQAVAS